MRATTMSGEAIQYTTADTPLGRMLAAATGHGICAIALGEHDSELLDELRGRFPGAEIHPVSDERRRGWLDEAIGYVVSQTSEHPLAVGFPLDARATEFQQRVWAMLRAIPRGETRSYSGLARQMGNARATRAVARAIATNPVAVVVPCHRVIGKDGSLTGYHWGLERKRQLLAAEQASASKPRRA